MTSPNPYSAPQVADVAKTAEPDDVLADLPFSDLKKLFNQSNTISAIAGLCIFFGILCLAVAFGFRESDALPILAAFGLFYLVTAVGLILRSGWGRILGILTGILLIVGCAVSIIGGTFNILMLLFGAMGVSGLIACLRADRCFGPHRITHKAIKNAYRIAKAGPSRLRQRRTR